MQSASIRKIDLRQASQAEQPFVCELEDDFFSSLEQDEIVGGHLHLSICVKENASGCFLLRLHLEGEVVVSCDRCLANLALPVLTDSEVKVCTDDIDVNPDEDVKVLNGMGYTYDASWDVYEAALLALPLKRVHKLSDCDPAMTARLVQKPVGDEDEDE